MKRRLALTWVIVALGGFSAAFAGSLTPPGAPAATMKTLDEVEARTPISSIPYTISASGSYYLTQDLGPAAQDTDGITITADNVTLDLNGFAVIGAGKTTGSSGRGIYIGGSNLRAICIRNGTIRDWRENGISALQSYDCVFESLRAVNNGSSGMLSYGYHCVVRRNVCNNNEGAGIAFIYGTHIITDNVCSSNGQSGISLGTVSSGCTVTGNTCNSNGSDGILAGRGSTVTGNMCSGNSSNGIRVGEDTTVTGNTCRYSGYDGINAEYYSTIEGNTCIYSTDDGIEVEGRCRVVGNTCGGNGYSEGDGAGILATNKRNHIDGNLVTYNDRGIDVDDSDNLITRNTSGGNTGTGSPSADYDIATGNNYGQILSSPGMGFTSTDPWANFSL